MDNQTFVTDGSSVQTRSATPSDESVRRFLTFLFPEPRDFTIQLWDNTRLDAQGDTRFSLVIRTPGALRRIFRVPLERALGEAYMRGDFDIEGDMFAAFRLLQTLTDRLNSFSDIIMLARLVAQLPKDKAAQHTERGAAQLSGDKHSFARDQAAIQYHYDVGNDFYALWLDRRMIYTCAYFPTGNEDLDKAQELKLEHICRKLRLQPGERLLDIGCGWGGLIIYAAQHYGVSAVGVTLSREQAQLANERIATAGLTDRVTVKLVDYRELANITFDKIVSVGMFEAIGKQQLSTYFKQAFRLLKPGGLFLNHGISINLAADRTKSISEYFFKRLIMRPGSFANRYVFPDGELAGVSEVNLVAERAGFEVRDVENLREHYALTLRHWVARLDANRERAIAVANESIYRIWRLYISASVYGFESGLENVNQSLLAKPDHGHVSLPRSRADIYAEYSPTMLP